MFDMKSPSSAGGGCSEVTLNVPKPDLESCSSEQSDVSEPRSEHVSTPHEPGAFANMSSASVGVDVPATWAHAVELDTIEFEGVLKLQVTRAKRAVSDGFLIFIPRVALFPACVFPGIVNDMKERLRPRMTFIVLLAFRECC